jgi:hypothetical protein
MSEAALWIFSFLVALIAIALVFSRNDEDDDDWPDDGYA